MRDFLMRFFMCVLGTWVMAGSCQSQNWHMLQKNATNQVLEEVDLGAQGKGFVSVELSLSPPAKQINWSLPPSSIFVKPDILCHYGVITDVAAFGRSVATCRTSYGEGQGCWCTVLRKDLLVGKKGYKAGIPWFALKTFGLFEADWQKIFADIQEGDIFVVVDLPLNLWGPTKACQLTGDAGGSSGKSLTENFVSEIVMEVFVRYLVLSHIVNVPIQNALEETLQALKIPFFPNLLEMITAYVTDYVAEISPWSDFVDGMQVNLVMGDSYARNSSGGMADVPYQLHCHKRKQQINNVPMKEAWDHLLGRFLEQGEGAFAQLGMKQFNPCTGQERELSLFFMVHEEIVNYLSGKSSKTKEDVEKILAGKSVPFFPVFQSQNTENQNILQINNPPRPPRPFQKNNNAIKETR